MLCYVVVLLQLFVRIASESSLYRQRSPCGMSRHQQLHGFCCPSQAYSQAAWLGCSATLYNPTTVTSHCAAHCCRLAQHYQLQLVSAKTILAAADELGGSTKQVAAPRQLCKPKQSLCNMH